MASGHEFEIHPVDGHVEVRLGGVLLAASDRAVALTETGLPTRYYLPREDVRNDLLQRTDHWTTCPLKGQASYWSVLADGRVYENLVWSYETPTPNAAGI